MIACLPLVQRVRVSIAGEVENFHIKILYLGATTGGDVQLLIARLYWTSRPGLNSKLFRITCVEKSYYTVDKVLSVGWGCEAWRSPWCLSTGVACVPAPGITFSLPFIIIVPRTTKYGTKQLHIVTLTSLSFSTQIQIHILHVTWSVQEMRELKI